MKGYLTIKEFAEAAGVSQQSIYKRLTKENNPLTTYLKEVENKKYIKASALSVLYGIKSDDDETEVVEQETQNEPEEIIKNSVDRLIDILEQQLQEKDRQIAEKERQLQEKEARIDMLQNKLFETQEALVEAQKENNKRISESNTLLNQQQILTAAEYNKNTAAVDDNKNKESEVKKKGILSFLKFWK